MVRSTPGKAENGPGALTSAMLIRQSKSRPTDPPATTSRVTPPPLRQGTGGSSAKRTMPWSSRWRSLLVASLNGVGEVERAGYGDAGTIGKVHI